MTIDPRPAPSAVRRPDAEPSGVPMPTTEVGTPAALQAMRVVLHVSFAGLLLLALVRFLASASWPGALWPLALSTALAAVYLAGTVLENRGFRGARAPARPLWSGLWLAVVLVLWILLALHAPGFSWVVFPLFFVVQAVLPATAGLAAVTALTAVVVAAQVLHSPAGGFGAGQVLGPAIGAVFAVISAWAYRALWRDALRHRRTVVQLQAARAELAHRERLAGELAERDRLSREIHDTLAQGLASIVLVSRAAQDALARGRLETTAEQLAILESTAAGDLAEARRFVRNLSSPRLAEGLEDALRELRRSAEDRAVSTGSGLSWSLRVEGEPRPLGEDAEAVLLRAAQSCVSNVEAHARASSAVLTLAYWPRATTLDIVDDGVGFDQTRSIASGPDGGFGLRHLRRRVDALGGRLTIESRPGSGTAVALGMPDQATARPSATEQTPVQGRQTR